MTFLSLLVTLALVVLLYAVISALVRARHGHTARAAAFVVGAMLGFGGVTMTATSCTGSHPVGPVIGGAVVNCLGQGRPAIDTLKEQLEQFVFGGGPVDWAKVWAQAKPSGIAIAGCAIAELVQDYLGGVRAPASLDSEGANRILEQAREENAKALGAKPADTHFRTLVNGRTVDL